MGIYIYTPYTSRVWGRGVFIFTIKGVYVYPTKYKKLSYNVYEHYFVIKASAIAPI